MPTDSPLILAAIPLENWAGFLVIVILAVYISLTLARRSAQRGASRRDVTREQRARLRDQREIRDGMDQLLVRLEEYSREVNGQLDTKFARLECVIRDADERIARLERLSGAEPAPAANPKSKIQNPKSASGMSAPPPARVALADSPMAEPAPRHDPRFVNVYDLADAGVPALQIAERLGMPAGEIELILNLRRME